MTAATFFRRIGVTLGGAVFLAVTVLAAIGLVLVLF